MIGAEKPGNYNRVLTISSLTINGMKCIYSIVFFIVCAYGFHIWYASESFSIEHMWSQFVVWPKIDFCLKKHWRFKQIKFHIFNVFSFLKSQWFAFRSTCVVLFSWVAFANCKSICSSLLFLSLFSLNEQLKQTCIDLTFFHTIRKTTLKRTRHLKYI
jgi:hypothetical protein